MNVLTVRIATRKSPLALWQATHVGTQLKALYPDINIKLLPLLTSGDRFNQTKLTEIGGKGLFVKELQQALLDNRADIAVHSMKDVPTESVDGLKIVTILKRDNPFDTFVSFHTPTLSELPHGARVGTASLRRQSQLLLKRPDLNIAPLRGNIQTRIEKLKTGLFDAIILAKAGLERMAIHCPYQVSISPEDMLPACGQGALGIECRIDDMALRERLMTLHDETTATCIGAERYVNQLLGGNCHAPVAVFATLLDMATIRIRARVLDIYGQAMIEACEQGPIKNAIMIAKQCADVLIKQGANDLLKKHS